MKDSGRIGLNKEGKEKRVCPDRRLWGRTRSWKNRSKVFLVNCYGILYKLIYHVRPYVSHTKNGTKTLLSSQI